MVFLFPNVWAKSGQSICFESCSVAEVPAFSLGLLWKLQPFHLCHRSQLSRLLPGSLLGSVPDLNLAGGWQPLLWPGANLCLQTPAQRDQEWGELGSRAGSEFPLAWGRLLGIFFFFSQAAYHLLISIPRWYQIVEVSETTEVARIRRSLSKAKQY